MFILDYKQLVKISLILSVSSFYIVLGEANNGLKMDNAITVLSTLITILIGWNIYAIIDIKGIKKEFERQETKIKNDANKMIDDKISEFTHTMNATVGIANLSVTDGMNAPVPIIELAIMNIDEALNGSNNNNVIRTAINFLYILSTVESLKDSPILKHGRRDYLLSVLDKVDDNIPNKANVVSFISNGQEE